MDWPEFWTWVATLIAALIALAMLSSCEAAKAVTTNKGIARITYYGKHEDKWGSRIACSKHRRAKVGHTLAAERRYPFGTRICIPTLSGICGNNGIFTVEDRGSAVERRQASHGRCPVFDIYAGTRRQMRKWAAVTPEYLTYEIQ